MAKVLVLYYSSYGHTEQLARAVAAGAIEVEGASAEMRRVADLVPVEVQENAGYKRDQAAPVMDDPDELSSYDAIIVGTPTRFGNMAAQMRNFWDQTGGLWADGSLIGKIGSAFTSTATQHGGQETTLTSIHTTMLHHGLLIAGVPYICEGISKMDEMTGGTPYGASTLAGQDGSRFPSGNELSVARFQGKHVAELAVRLHG